MALVFNSFEDAGIKLSATALIEKGQYKMKCPSCSSTSKHKNKKDLSVFVRDKVFKCWNPGCDFNGLIAERAEAKKFEKPVALNAIQTIDIKWVDYFAKRGISQPTLIKMGVISSTKETKIAIPFVVGTELIFYKFRTIDKGFSTSPNAEMVFYNLDSVKGKETVIIVEGEPDVWTLIEAGLDSKYGIISVPNGANLNGGKLEYFDRGAKHLTNVKKFIIAVDNDVAGEVLKEELCRRLGKDRCLIAKFGDKKDANDYWQTIMDRSDRNALIAKCITDAKPYPIEGVYTVDDCRDELDDLYNGVISNGDKVGWDEFDKYCSFDKGYGVAVISGPPNTAKSDFLFNIAVRLAAIHGRKFGILSPETGSSSRVIRALFQIYVGKPMRRESVPAGEYEHGLNWIKEHFFIIDDMKLSDMKIETFYAAIKKLVFEHGITDAIADPFNNFENSFTGSGLDMASHLNKILTEAQTFSKMNSVHLYFGVHPKAFDTAFDMKIYDMNGGAAWMNKSDIVIFLRRLYEDKANSERRFANGLGDDIKVQVKKVKKRENGRRGEVVMSYAVLTGIMAESAHFQGIQSSLIEIKDKVNTDNYEDIIIPF